MKNPVLKSVISVVAITLALGFTGLDAARGGEKVYKVQVPSQMPVGHPITIAMKLFCDTVNEKSNGRMEVSFFPAGQLLTDREVPKGISKGTVKMAQTFLVWWSGMIPDIMPYGGTNPLTLDHFLRFSRGPLLNHIERRLSEKGNAVVVAPLLYGFKSGYILKEPVRKLGDMEGMKIRIPSKVLAAEVQALGGVPTVMSSADVYMALQRGTIQGGISGLPSFYVRKWYEAAKFVFVLRPLPADFHIVANKKWFEGLPADLQQIIVDAGKTASEACTEMVVEGENKIEAGLKAKGVTIHKVSIEEYHKVFEPVVKPALDAAAVKQFGQALTDQYNEWVESTK